MQLRALSLRNIRSYRAVDLELGPGTTLVSGDVGAGKTSLLYAVEMALFGFAEVDPTFLVRHDESTARVTLELADSTHRYQLRREFRRKSRRGRDQFELTESSFSVDGARTNYPATELRQRVIELLGFPDNPNPRAHSDFWRWAVYIAQERMREVLAQNAEDRLATVRKALGVEQYQTAAENASEVVRELRRRAELREAEAERLEFFEEDLARATTELDSHVRTVAELEARHRAATMERVSLDAKIQALQNDRLRMEAQRGQLEGQTARLAHLERTVSSRSTRLQEIAQRRVGLLDELAGRSDGPRRVEGLERSLNETEGLLTALRPRWTELESALEASATLEEQVGRARASVVDEEERNRAKGEELGSLEERLRQLESSGPRARPAAPTPRALGDLDETLTDIDGRLASLLRSVAAGQHELDELKELLENGSCPRCHQPVRPADFAVHRDELAQEVEHREAQLSSVQAERQATLDERSSRERYERVLVRWEEAEAHRSTVREALARVEDEQRAGETRLKAARESVRLLEQALVERSSVTEVTRRLRLEKDWAEAELAETRLEFRALAQLIDRDSNLAAEADRLRHQEAEEQVSVDAATEELRSVRAVVDALRVELRGQTELLERLDEASRARLQIEAELQSLAAQQASQSALADAARRRIETAARGMADRRQRLEQARRLRVMGEWLSGPFREAALRLEKRVLGRAQGDFDHALRRYFATLVEDPALIARADAAFGPAVEVDGAWTPPEALSGGERTALALAFRLALGQVVRGLGQLRLETLVLDEPTDGFSPEQVLRLGDLLEEIRVPQVLIVSHEPGLGGIADRVIRVEKVHGESKVLGGTAGPETPPTSVTEVPRATGVSRPRKRKSKPLEPPNGLTAETR